MAIEVRSSALTVSRARASQQSGSPAGSKLSGTDRMFFTERLSLMLETGNPVHVGLEAMAREAQDPDSRALIHDLRESVGSGLAFSQALAKHPRAFPKTYVSLVEAGERGGFLAEVLDRLREMDERQEDLRSTLRGALAYPAFLIVVSMAVMVFVLVAVFPKFEDLFSLIKDQLPPTTRVLMATSNLLRAHWLAFLAGISGGVLAMRAWLRTPAGAARADRVLLRMPVIRAVVIQFDLVQFLRVMSLALGNGVGALDSLASCRTTVRGESFRQLIGKMEVRVREGQGIASTFASASFVPRLARELVATGEEVGNLPLVMSRVADYYEREWRKRIATLTRMIEPILLLVMGAGVGLLVSSLILPIFKLSRAVH